MTLAIANQAKTQLLLHRLKLRRTAQRVVERTKLRCKTDQVTCNECGSGSAVKTARMDTNLDGQPIVIPIRADRLSLVAKYLHLKALLL